MSPLKLPLLLEPVSEYCFFSFDDIILLPVLPERPVLPEVAVPSEEPRKK